MGDLSGQSSLWSVVRGGFLPCEWREHYRQEGGLASRPVSAGNSPRDLEQGPASFLSLSFLIC